MPSNNKSTTTRDKAPSLLQIFKYCLPHMGIITIIPITCVVLALILRAFGIYAAAEFITSYIAFPLFVIMPLIATMKVIDTLKRSFPRKSHSHRVFLSLLFTSSLTTIAIEIFFNIGCLMYGFFPMEFRGAGYMRDMYTSSPAAMNIFYISIFIFYAYVSLMTITSYFIGDRSVKKFKFTVSCLVFAALYIVFLVLFLLTYFGATFLDIIALENIQIAGSIFNSSMLCAFICFDILAIATSPALYFLTIKFLNKKSKKSK